MHPGSPIEITGHQSYDVTHDMVGKGVWKATGNDDSNPKEDKKILERDAQDKAYTEGVKAVAVEKAT